MTKSTGDELETVEAAGLLDVLDLVHREQEAETDPEADSGAEAEPEADKPVVFVREGFVLHPEADSKPEIGWLCLPEGGLSGAESRPLGEWDLLHPGRDLERELEA